MNKEDQTLVETVFGEIISLAYLVKRQHDKLLEIKDNKERNTITRTINRQELIDKIETIHEKVDICSLHVSESVRYKLHRILMEVQDFYAENSWNIERWEDIDTVKKDGCNYISIDMRDLSLYRRSLDRDTGIIEAGFYYISDEIDLAESLGYFNNTEIPEDLWDNMDAGGWGFDGEDRRLTLEEMIGYGFSGTDDCGTELNPQIVAVDQMLRLMKEVFKHDFPEMNIR